MANSDRDDFIELTADGFDLEREMLYEPGLSVRLLKRQGRNIPFVQKLLINKAFRVEFPSRERGRIIIEIATLVNIGEYAVNSSHLSWQGFVYLIGNGDIVPPNDERFTWIISGSITGDKYP